MKNIKRAEDLQKAVKLVRSSLDGKEVSAEEFRNILLNTCLLVDNLMKENAKLKNTAKRFSQREKQSLVMYQPFAHVRK